MGRTIVHVGPHKTGSTWLQRSVFPAIDGIRYVGGDLQAADGDETVIVSDESLAGDLWDPEPVSAAAERLARRVPDAEVLIVTRSPDKWRRSVFAQYVNEGGHLPAERFWREVPTSDAGADAEALVGAFRERFGTVHVIAFEELAADPAGTAETVAALVGGRLTSAPAAQGRNRSLSRPCLAALRWWNRAFRRSRFNPSPILPLPWAPRMRFWMQNRIDPLVPDRWR